MTTNSPYPVDGDVQALIEQCKDNIDTLTVALKHCGQEEADEIYRNLELQKVALAALTAEPVAHRYAYLPGIGDADWKYVDSSEYANKSSGYSGQDLYTTPPAQLLRPVELPGGGLMQVAFETDPVNADMCLCVSRDAAVRAIREAGYEVKND